MKIRALVMDNSGLMRRALMGALAASGLGQFEFTEAGNHAEALERFDPDATDLVFLNLDAATRIGFRLVGALRGKQKRYVPIVAVGGGDQALQKTDAMGVDHCLTRPITPQILRAKLAALIQRIAARPAAAGHET